MIYILYVDHFIYYMLYILEHIVNFTLVWVKYHPHECEVNYIYICHIYVDNNKILVTNSVHI